MTLFLGSVSKMAVGGRLVSLNLWVTSGFRSTHAEATTSISSRIRSFPPEKNPHSYPRLSATRFLSVTVFSHDGHPQLGHSIDIIETLVLRGVRNADVT